MVALGRSPNREMRFEGHIFRTMVIDSFAVCAMAPSLLKQHIGTVYSPSAQTPPHPAHLLNITHSKDFIFPYGHPVHRTNKWTCMTPNLFVVNLQYIFRQHNTSELIYNATCFDSMESWSGLLFKNRHYVVTLPYYISNFCIRDPLCITWMKTGY